MISGLRHSAAQDFEPEILLVAQPTGAALKDADLVVHSLDEAERHLEIGLGVSRHAVPWRSIIAVSFSYRLGLSARGGGHGDRVQL